MVVIVYGALRSGTTLLRLMLDTHPALSCPGEADYLFDYAVVKENGDITLNKAGLLQDRIFQSSGTTLNGELDESASIEDLVQQLRGKAGRTVILMLHRGIEKAIKIFPDAKIIHMVRDPRDVAKSCIPMGWAGNTYFGVDYWLKTEREWENLDKVKVEKSTLLRYESLIENSGKELERLTDYIGVPYDTSMLTYAEDTTYKLPDPSLIFQWKSKQNPIEVALVEGKIGNLLTDRGYEASGEPAMHPNFWHAQKLKIQNKSYIWSVRIKRFGLIDPLLVSLSGRLQMPWIGINAQGRINTKLKKYLK